MNAVFQRFSQIFATPWALGALVIIGLFFWSRDGDISPLTAEGAKAKIFPQTFMTSVETREYDTNGILQHQLNTPYITQYQVNPEPSAEDYALFEQPRMIFYDKDQSPWQLTSKLGRSDKKGQLFTLTDDVIIAQQTPERGLTQVMTTELVVHTAEQFADTDKAVKMRSATVQMDAVGMTAHLQDNRIQLKSQVRAVYEPR